MGQEKDSLITTGKREEKKKPKIKEQVIPRQSLTTSHCLASPQATVTSENLLLRFKCWAWHYMARNIYLPRRDQLFQSCSVPACPHPRPPCWWAERRTEKALSLCNHCSAIAKRLVYQHCLSHKSEIHQHTGLLWRKSSPCQTQYSTTTERVIKGLRVVIRRRPCMKKQLVN